MRAGWLAGVHGCACDRPVLFSPDCICFPANEQPEFKWRVEAEVAAKVLCPLHGLRFQVVVTRYLYRAVRFHITDFKWGWPDRSPQYQKAMRASFDLTVWPAQPVVCPPQEEHNRQDIDQPTLILRDGTELASGGTAIDYRPGPGK